MTYSGAEPPRPRLWLTHHAAEQHDRCATVAGRLVCRRCLVTYPIALIAAGLSLAGVHWPAPLDPALLWLLPLPAIADFVGEHLFGFRYNPTRQKLLSAVAAVAFGRGLGRYLLDPSDSLFWAVAVTYSLVMALSAMVGALREKQAAARATEIASLAWWDELQQNLERADGDAWRSDDPYPGALNSSEAAVRSPAS